MNEKCINFVFQTPEDVDCIRVDRLRFSQIFFNLLSNAAKFTPTGGTVEFTGRKVAQEGEKVKMEFCVKDNGIDATREIRALSRNDAKTVPVIAMTADAFDEERKQTLDAGMNYHLSKPINPQLLYSVLSKYICAC